MSLGLGQAVQIGRYEAIARIASGGMGAVYLARATGVGGFERLVALKLIHDHLSEDDDRFAEMLLQEARLAAQVRHPNVVAIVDVDLHEGAPYLVMDYVEGCTLAELVRRAKAHRPLDVFLTVMTGALDGLHAAHVLKDEEGKALNLVHRDFSPQNILVGVDGTARITDFGIAKAESSLQTTLPGSVRGKPAYMAPEQIHSQPLDRRCDVFAAGIVLWSLLTGRHLFKGSSAAATMKKVLQDEVVPPSRYVDCPPELDRICARALQRDRDARYPSALAMATDIREVAQSHGLVAAPTAVGAFVEQTFWEVLERRREAIRSAASREGPPRSISAAWRPTRESSLPGGSGTPPVTQTRRDVPSAEMVSAPVRGSRPVVWALLTLLLLGVVGLVATQMTPPAKQAERVPAPPPSPPPSPPPPAMAAPPSAPPPPPPAPPVQAEKRRKPPRKVPRRRPPPAKKKPDDFEVVEPNPYLR